MTLPDINPQLSDLNEAERQLLNAATRGTLVDLQVGDVDIDNPARGATWGAERTVRAEVLVELLTGEQTHDEAGRPRAVKLRGARISGALNVEAAQLACPLLLADCHVEQPINLNEVTAPAIRLPGCHMPGLAADQLRTAGNLELNAGCTVAGEVTLRGARIGGQLSLAGAHLINPGGRALTGSGLTIEQDFVCGEGFFCEGEIALHNGHVGGRFALDTATLSNPGGRALTGPGITVDGFLWCGKGFTAKGEIRLPGAYIGGLCNLAGAQIDNPDGAALFAARLTVDGDLQCNGITANGKVDLSGARIGGHVNLDGARILNRGGHALQVDWAAIGQYMLCTDGFVADGEVSLANARIGRLNLSGATLTNRGGRALTGDGLTVEQDLLCRDGFTAEGEISLRGARVGGRFTLGGARLINPGGRALIAISLAVAGPMYAEGLTVAGEIRLIGARIGGVCNLTGARLTNPGGHALYAVRLSVDSDLLCRRGFVAEGKIELSGADISGQFELDGARLTNPGAIALHGESLTIRQALTCWDGFTAEGEIHLANAHIGRLNLSAATLINPNGHALNADRLIVDRNLFCRDGFTAKGTVRLVGARIGGRLSFNDAVLINPDALAVDLEAATANELILRPGRTEGGVDLTNARVGLFGDDPAALTANNPGRLLLRGFTYETLDNDKVDVQARLRWLTHHQHGYTSQIYDQLAAAYRRAGDEQAARKVAIAKQWRRRAALNPAGKLANWLLYLTVGYGYRTWLAALWLAGLLACGTWIFDRAYPTDMVRTDAHGPAFHALAYTLDVLVPIVDLGQQKSWQPQGAAMYWSWAFMGAGWVLTTAVAAGLTGLARWARS
jgi:hypothetical protein